MGPFQTPRDPNTLSNYHNWRTVHTDVDLEILFDEQKLQGSVTHRLKSLTNSESKEIILDCNHVSIANVKVNGETANWELMPRLEPYGTGLKITLERGTPLGDFVEVTVSLATTPACTALQWLTPAQTSTKKHPYMFSQCQAIHARTIFPCQDTPDVKATFGFKITSPLPTIASGIAASSNDHGAETQGGTKEYVFHQAVPIPSYLFAVASGDLSIAAIGPRSKVATSPDQLEACKWEFEESTESFVQAGESLVYKYAWGEYNILVLPPSFPYGGMENPVYTFATPTLISGDRQNIGVIAHELAHSWSGNLVSNASWEHFWLNEGWTTYLERRIQALIYGNDARRHLSAILGWKGLTDAIAQFGEDHEYTKLVPNLKGKDPDDAFSTVPYEKGSTFIWYLETLVGKEAFDKFIPYYFETWRGKSLDSYDFKATLFGFFQDNGEITEKLEAVDWDTWFYAPGFPPKPDFNTALVDEALGLAKKWETFTQHRDISPEDSTSPFVPRYQDVEHLSARQIQVFLDTVLLFDQPLPAPHAIYMGAIYRFRDSQNVEVSSRYFQVCMQAGDINVLTLVEGLLGKVGRMRFVRPLIRGLIKADRNRAVRCFETNKDFWHPICRAMVAKEIFGRPE